MTAWRDKTVLVTGGSAGLGFAIAGAFARQGARVVIAGRDAPRLEEAVQRLAEQGAQAAAHVADVTRQEEVDRLVGAAVAETGRLDALVNNVGRSSRGAVLETSAEQFQQMLDVNFLSLVRCTRAAAPHLLASKGHIINIGSLASKSAARFLGAYPAAKFAVAAYSQQLRLELAEQGVHVLLVCPGPIRRDDAGQRYDDQAGSLPDSVRKPGGGVKIKGLDPDRLAERIVAACERRQPELVLPAKARLLFTLSQLSPRLGDWLVRKMSS